MTFGFEDLTSRDNDALFASEAAIAAEYRPQGSDPHPVTVIMESYNDGRDLRATSRPHRRSYSVLVRETEMPPGWPEPKYQDKLFAAGREWTVLQELNREFGLIEFQVDRGPSTGF